MSKKKPQQKPANKPLLDVLEEEAAPKAAKKTSRVGNRYFNRNMSIPGFGFVVAGDLLTEEALVAWKKKTKVDIDKFVGDTIPEQPKTDKEKLAEYEALKKE